MSIGRWQDFEVHSGNDRTLEVTVWNDDDTAVVDITGASLTWEVSALDPDQANPTPTGAALKSLSTGGGEITLVDPTNGRADIALAAAETADLSGDYYHELEMVLGGATTTVMFGKMTVRKDLVTPT